METPYDFLLGGKRRIEAFSGQGLLAFKLAYLFFTILSPFTPMAPGVFPVLLVSSTLLVILVGGGRVLAKIYAWLGATGLFIILLDYLAGTDYVHAAWMMLYTAATVSTLFFVAVTTPVSQLEKILGRNTLTQSLIFLEALVHELSEVMDTFKARGFEPRRPLDSVPIVVAFMSCVSERLAAVEESALARGVEK